MKHDSGPNALRRGRTSRPYGDYFLTVCVEPRISILTGVTAANTLKVCHELDIERAWRIRCVTVMLDHLHLLVTLGDILTLSQAVAKLKVTTNRLLVVASARWQDNFYDHQLRSDESAEPVIRYIYLNPYEAGLIAADKSWPYFYCSEADWSWFQQLTDHGKPYPEWLR